ncbi:FTR1 family protein [Bacillus methanolicus]|uniref:FTR1 family protein n=1 Tax=Bacillus methanolicus TaxID=1471 RepID=UPI00200D9BB9|nr:FTR1 family protein [Bacillus methanolicus]
MNIIQDQAIINTSILVFREGLESILVLSAIISGLVHKKQDNHWKPISAGAGVLFWVFISFYVLLACWIYVLHNHV